MIITLGPSGTYSEIAAHKLFPDKEIVLRDSIFEIFANHEAGDTMVLPLENSFYGSVVDVWEAVVSRGLFIVKTITLDIIHSIGSLEPEKIQTIIGHPQALGQCNSFLHSNYPNHKIEAATSTGAAIQKALNDPTYAAIGNHEIMEQMGLKIVNQTINDAKNNRTMFGVVTDQELFHDQDKEKTLIVIEPKVDRPGLLLEILQIIAQNNVNLTRLESRPQGNELGFYKFFLDLNAAPDSLEFKTIFTELGLKHKVHIIGAY